MWNDDKISNRITYNDVVFKLFLSTLIGNLLLKRIIYRLLIFVEGVYLVYLLTSNSLSLALSLAHSSLVCSSNHLYILNEEKKITERSVKWNQNKKNCSLPCFNIIDFLSHSLTPFFFLFQASFFWRSPNI